MSSLKYAFLRTIYISAILSIFSLFSTSDILSQTVENPIEIYMSPVDATLAPGQASALTITFRIPQGFWLGDNDRSERMPSATIIDLQKQKYFVFEQALFPDPEVRGVPVHLGITRVFTGEIKVIVPYEITEDAPPGDFSISRDRLEISGKNEC